MVKLAARFIDECYILWREVKRRSLFALINFPPIQAG